jgi:hypothetical protein
MKMPAYILKKFEQAALGLNYGTVTLTLHIKQGKPRYVIAREESCIPSEEQPNQDIISAYRAPDLAASIAESNQQIREFFYSP